MAECTDISAALARLERKIEACCNNRLTEADVNRISQMSVFGSAAWTNVAGGMIALNGELQRRRVKEISEEVTKKRLEAQVTALQTRVSRIEIQAGLAKAEAATALARAGQVASSVGDSVARISGIVGAVAGIASIYTQIKILIPQINASEARITTLEIRETESFSKAIAANEVAMKANKLAAAAKASADVAALNAIDANRKAGSALQLATLAKQIADVAIGESGVARTLANKAQGLAKTAVTTAIEAANQIPGIRAIANNAKVSADNANAKSDSALQQIPPVRAIANTANAKADNANAKADSALQQIPPVRAIANTANAKADNANAKADSALQQIPPVRAIANTANAKADNANAKADSALKQIPQVRAIALGAAAGAAAAQAAANEAKNYAIARMQRFGDAIVRVRAFEAETVPRIVRKVEQNTSQSRQAETKATNAQKTAWQTVSIVNIANDKLEKVSRQVYTTTGTVSAKDPAIVQIKNEIKRVETKTVNKDELKTAITESIKPDMFSDAVKVGVAASLPLLISASQKGLQQSLPAIEAAAAAGTCRTTQPGGCTTRALDSLGDRMGSKFDKVMDAYNAAANTAQLTMLVPMQRTLNRVDRTVTANGSKLGQLLNRINDFREFAADKIDKLYKALGLDRAVQLMTLAASLHNASMLSVSLKDTLLETTANIMAVVGIKDAEGNALDLNQIFGKQLEDLIKSIVGEQTYTNTKTLWLKANRIISTGSNLLWSFQSMQHTLTSGVEVVGGWVAKIGNNMKDEGLVSDRAYGWFNENPNFKNPILTQMEKLDNLEEAASQVNQLASTVLEFKQTGDQIKTQKAELDKQITDFNTTRAAIDAQNDTQSTPKTITSTDLLKHEPE